MREYTAHKKNILTAVGKQREITYFIVAEELTGEDGRVVCECYGAAVGDDLGEKNTVKAITVSHGQIKALVEELAHNDVLPTELPDAVENLLYAK